jgi:hypothetical protein
MQFAVIYTNFAVMGYKNLQGVALHGVTTYYGNITHKMVKERGLKLRKSGWPSGLRRCVQVAVLF